RGPKTRFFKHKKFEILAAFLLLGFLSVAFVWDYHMKNTWDHHIVADLTSYYLEKKGGAKWVPLDKKDIEDLSRSVEIPRNLEIVKKENEYIWVSNDNKKLTKHVLEGSRRFYVYST